MDDRLFPDLLNESPDGVIFADKSGLISYWNAAAEAIFGHPASTALGQSLDLIIPEALREAHWRGFDRALETGDTKHHGKALPTKAIRADGETIYVELSFAVVKHDGVVAGAMACARDITERFAQDREMRRRLRELEAAAQPAQ